MSPDDDPFAPVNDSLPQTPPTRSSNAWLLSYSPSQTHPAESPTYSPNTIGLRFGNRKGRNLIREGAVILRPKQRVPVPTSPTPRVPNYYRVKQVVNPVAGIFTDCEFRSTLVGPADEGGEIEFPTFDPDIFQLCTALRSKALCLTERSGITKEELAMLCVQCIRCENIVSRVTQHSHRCPAPSQDKTDGMASVDDIFQSLEYRLDAVGDQESALSGLTKTEVEELFSVCTVCNHYVMASGRGGHLCFA